MSSTDNDKATKEAVTEKPEEEAPPKEHEKAPKEGEITRKRSSSSSTENALDDAKRVRTDFVDMAVKMGFKAGDRLEVEWEVGEENVTKRWWGGVLLEHDGRIAEGFAIRVIDYDPFPEGGFPERSQEDVIFVTQNALLDADSGEELLFRREGEDMTVAVGEDDLNDMMMNVLSKNGEAWSKLTAAQQATVAGIVAIGKERLLDAVKKRWEEQPNKPISCEEIPGIMQEAFGDM